MIVSDIGLRNLCAAIIEQAVIDWRVLCKLTAEDRIVYMSMQRTIYRNKNGKRSYIGTSFQEIEQFFMEQAENYTDMDKDMMLKILKNERKKANRKRDRLRARKNDVTPH